MAALKRLEIEKMSKADRVKKINALKLELMKSTTGTGKSNNTKQIKKMIARIYTIDNFLEVPNANTKTSTKELKK